MDVVCCQVEVSAAGRCVIHRSRTEWDAYQSDLQISTIGQPNHEWAVAPQRSMYMVMGKPVKIVNRYVAKVSHLHFKGNRPELRIDSFFYGLRFTDRIAQSV